MKGLATETAAFEMDSKQLEVNLKKNKNSDHSIQLAENQVGSGLKKSENKTIGIPKSKEVRKWNWYKAVGSSIVTQMVGTIVAFFYSGF